MKIVLRVRCDNPQLDDYPGLFAADIDEELAARIKKLAVLIDVADTYQIAEFNDVGDYYNCVAEDLSFCTTDDAVLVKLGELVTAKTECNMLRVTKTVFTFSCYPKHSDAGFRLTTVQVPVTALDSGADVFLNLE